MKKIKAALSTLNIDLSEALDTSSAFWMTSTITDNALLPFKQNIIHAYLLVRKSDEEMELLRQEMTNIICFFRNKRDIIRTKIVDFHSQGGDSQLIRGSVSLLLKLLTQVERLFSRAIKTFSKYIPIVIDKNDCTILVSSDLAEWSSDDDFSSDDEF